MNKKWYLLANVILWSQILGVSGTIVTKADLSMDTAEMVTPAAAVATYVCTHLDEINTYRQEHGFYNDVVSATVSDITVHEYNRIEDIDAKLLDFDGSKGYIIVGENYMFYGFAFEGEIPFNDFTDGDRYYSDQEGFYYINFQQQKVVLGHLTGSDPLSSSTQPFDGQYVAGEGRIYDLDAYIADRYGTSLTFVKENSIKTENGYPATGFAIADYNCYLDPNGNIPNINNFIAAMSTTFMIGRAKFLLQINKEYSKLQEINYLPGIHEPEICETKLEEGYTQLMRTLRQFPYKFRQMSNNLYGGVENLTQAQAVELTKAYCESKGHTYTSSTTRFIAVELEKEQNYFDTKNLPALLYIPESDTYDDLTLLYACGYKTYYKIVRVSSHIQKIYFYHFVEVMDGLVENERTYFDLYGTSSNNRITFFSEKNS